MTKRIRRAFLSASVAAMLTASTISVSRADPATAYLVVTAIQTGMSLFGPKSPDVTAATIRAQSVAIAQIHHRLDALEGSVSTLLTMVAVIPEEVQKLLQQNSEAVRAATLKGVTSTLQSDLSNLAALKEEGTKKAKEAEKHDFLTRITLDQLRTERTALFDDSDFALPYIVMALDAEMAALTALPPIRNEISVQLKAYDARIGKMLDESRPDSLVTIRANLQKKQAEEAIAIGKAVSKNEEFSEGTWPWYSHTFVGEQAYTCTYCPMPGNQEKYNVWCPPPYKNQSYPCKTLYMHQRSLQRQIVKVPLENAAGPEVFSLKLNYIAPATTEKARNPLPNKHTSSDEVFEKGMMDADQPLRFTVDNFNHRAAAIAKVVELEQLAIFARILIAKWDVVDAARLLQEADLAGKTKIAGMLNQVEQNKRNEEARLRIEAMTQARETAWEEIKKANEELDATIKEAKDNAWSQDVMFILDLYKFSYQVAQVSERLGIFTDNPPEVAQKEAVKKLAKSQPKAGQSLTTNEIIDKIVSLGLSDDEKARAILQMLEKVKPAESWGLAPLPKSATLPETQIAYMATLLDSMASAQIPSINESYDKALANAGTGKQGLLVAALLPSPGNAEGLADDLSRRQMRQQINALARGYAKLRLKERINAK
ncbi:hypothetical protein [Rhizobium leguminosarum]|uniref:hypothetical protein n=1 Tax=Rhizobium leguminosarum TaxID=384 RepID=UPI001030AFAC|nr:hypothetical protein [Rhizobium leguminosarum]TBF89176.1 hypothetical protein ELG82_37155 [Rhizobium leguminosarum]